LNFPVQRASFPVPSINPGYFAIIYPERANFVSITCRNTDMTNIGDVIRQIETVKCDQQYPPTPEQQETLNKILYNVYSGTVEFKGSR
jgi:hypothetical protein